MPDYWECHGSIEGLKIKSNLTEAVESMGDCDYILTPPLNQICGLV